MKKLRILSAAMLAATVLGMASCDVEMELKSDLQNVEIVNNVSVFSNKLKQLYDSVVTSGDSNSEKILNNVLFAYGQTYFGFFYGEGGLYEAVNDEAKMATFLSKHGTAFASKEEVVDFYNTLLTSIEKSFWSQVSNSSYQKSSYFKEELFVKAQRADLYKLDELPEGESFVKKQMNGSNSWENVLEYFHGNSVESLLTYYQDYIEKSLLPNAYRKALIEEYLINNNYGTLGRSYARKVQYVSLPSLDKYEESTRLLVTQYCAIVLSKTDDEIKGVVTPKVATRALANISDDDVAYVRDLHFLNELYKGYMGNWSEGVRLIASEIYSAANFTYVAPYKATEEDSSYQTEATYLETSYGQLVDDFKHLSDSRWETGTSTDFTNSGAYAPVNGLISKTNDIIASTKVTEGWYTSSGLSDLPSTMKTRLFKTQVANEVDNPTTADQANVTSTKFTWKVQGSYYLRPETIQSGDQYPYAMYDDSTKTWYIIRIDEAVKSPKLEQNKDIAESYLNRTDASRETLNQIVWDIADLIADGDSYKKAARQYYVENMDMTFHDDDVYDYFETTFPDLFD